MLLQSFHTPRILFLCLLQGLLYRIWISFPPVWQSNICSCAYDRFCRSFKPAFSAQVLHLDFRNDASVYHAVNCSCWRGLYLFHLCPVHQLFRRPVVFDLLFDIMDLLFLISGWTMASGPSLFIFFLGFYREISIMLFEIAPGTVWIPFYLSGNGGRTSMKCLCNSAHTHAQTEKLIDAGTLIYVNMVIVHRLISILCFLVTHIVA